MKKLGNDIFLNPNLYEELDKINSLNIFSYRSEYEEKHILTIAVVNRLKQAVQFLNKHEKYPNSEDEFILFMVYSCMVFDAVENLLKKFDEDFDKTEKKYFIKTQQGEFFPVEECDFLSDYKMFKYLRALIFAHPFNTDQHFKKYFSNQISPWFSIDNTWTMFSKSNKNRIGIHVFVVNKENKKDTILLDVYFDELKVYVNSCYLYLEKVVKWFKDEKSKVETEWKEKKINRNLDPISLIEEIDKLLIERHMGVHGLKQLCFYLACPCTEKANEMIVNNYRESIINRLPEMCDAVDNLDKNKIESIVADLTRVSKKMSFNTYQQLEGIYSYLHESFQRNVSVKGSDEEEVLSLVNEFAKGFAKKWVKIDTVTMSNSEIKMLVAVACYFEKLRQERKVNKKGEFLGVK